MAFRSNQEGGRLKWEWGGVRQCVPSCWWRLILEWHAMNPSCLKGQSVVSTCVLYNDVCTLIDYSSKCTGRSRLPAIASPAFTQHVASGRLQLLACVVAVLLDWPFVFIDCTAMADSPWPDGGDVGELHWILVRVMEQDDLSNQAHETLRWYGRTFLS